jgi:pyruvate dehydrogenase E1 component
MASMVPNCRAWDPAFAGELAVIVEYGMKRMLTEGHDEFHYITLMNENYAMPSLPRDAAADVLRGMYRHSGHGDEQSPTRVRLLGSGTILLEVIAASELLATDWGISSDVFSVTSFSELARDACELQRRNRLAPDEPTGPSHLERLLPGDQPVVAATDHVRAWPQLIAEYLQAPYTCLGTDGFGRSDTRQRLRAFFEVDRFQIVIAALSSLVRSNRLSGDVLRAAIQKYDVRAAVSPPWRM